MVAIPTYLVLGDFQLNGNAAEPAASIGAEYLAQLAVPGSGAGSFSDGLLDDVLLGDVPDNTGTASVPVHAYRPWWDGTAGEQFTVPTGSYGGLSLTMPGASWTLNEHAGRKLYVDATAGGSLGPSFGMIFTIVSNSTNMLVLSNGLTKENLPGATLVDNGQNILCHIGTGAWVRYQHIANRAIGPLQTSLAMGAGLLGTQGDCWYQTDNSPGAWGSTMSLMQRLESIHGTAPGFRAFKLALVSGYAGMNGGAPWGTFVAEYDKAAAHATFGSPGDTPDVQGVVLNFSHYLFTISNPVTQAAEIASYITDAIGTLTLLQAKFGAVRFWLVTPSSGFRPDVAGVVYDQLAADLRYANKILAQLSQFDIVLVDLNAYPVQLNETTGLRDQYRSHDILAMGDQIARAIRAFRDQTVQVAPGTALPTFLWLGDSQMVGQVPLTYVLASLSPRLLGPTFQSAGPIMVTERPGQLVYNGNSGEIETYDVQVNENTIPDVGSLYFGPTCSGLATLGVQWPEVLVVKIASGGSTVTEEARQYQITQGQTEFLTWDIETTGQYSAFEIAQETMSDLFSRIYDQRQRLADVRGAVVMLGDNDTWVTASSAVMQDKFRALLGAIRQHFYTRSSGTMQIVVVLPPTHVDNGGQSEFGNPSVRQAVRAAIQAVVASDQNTQSLDGDSYELQNEGASDRSVHYSGQALIQIGDDAAALMIQMLGSSADGPTIIIQAGDDDGGDDEGGGGVDGPELPGTSDPVEIPLVVEDGTALANSDSYLSLTDIRTFAMQIGNPTEISTATDAQLQAWARMSARFGIDYVFGQAWSGIRVREDQALDWPRQGAGDQRTQLIVRENVVPQDIRWCQFWYIMALAVGIDVLRTLNHLDAEARQLWATSYSESLPGGLSESTTWANGPPRASILPRMNQSAEPFLVGESDLVGSA